jgi:hypothetical protein
MIMEFREDEQCDVLLTPGACVSPPGIAEREYVLLYPGRLHLDTNVFRRLEQRLPDIGTVTPMGHVNVVYRRIVQTPADEYATTAAV